VIEGVYARRRKALHGEMPMEGPVTHASPLTDEQIAELKLRLSKRQRVYDDSEAFGARAKRAAKKRKRLGWGRRNRRLGP
jgi:hypothetical protein